MLPLRLKSLCGPWFILSLTALTRFRGRVVDFLFLHCYVAVVMALWHGLQGSLCISKLPTQCVVFPWLWGFGSIKRLDSCSCAIYLLPRLFGWMQNILRIHLKMQGDYRMRYVVFFWSFSVIPFVGVLLFLTSRNWGAISDRQCYPFIFILVDLLWIWNLCLPFFSFWQNFLVANKNLRKIYL